MLSGILDTLRAKDKLEKARQLIGALDVNLASRDRVLREGSRNSSICL